MTPTMVEPEAAPLLPYQSALGPAPAMNWVLLLLGAWLASAGVVGVATIGFACSKLVEMPGEVPGIGWILVVLAWGAVLAGCAQGAQGWWNIYDGRTVAVKNMLGSLGFMLNWWRLGYTVLGIAGTLGALSGESTLNLMALALAAAWGILHGTLHRIRRQMREAARLRWIHVAGSEPAGFDGTVVGPVRDYASRAGRYLRAVRGGA